MANNKENSDAVDLDVGYLLQQRRFEPIAQPFDPRHVLVVVLGRQRDPPGEPDDVRHVLGPGAAAFFLVAADHQRPAGRAAAHEQRADALGGV